MKLYHGSLVTVEKPLIIPRESGKTADFGAGFYTTTDYKQAERWVTIRKGTEQNQKGFISEYDAADNLLSLPELKIKKFNNADEEWLDFVIENRRNANFSHNYDIVYGPVANDRVYTTINLYEDELLSKEETIIRLKTFTLVDQVLFHTEKALTYLNFVRSTSL
ncbi:MAG: DUF3990 domain-containing protein [Treponema sp.]|nr:DUF3990 domain-containing protein [Treponema sp.]